MDQRWNSRESVNLNVILISGNIGLVNGKTRDVSFGGMYIEMAPGICMDEYASVHLVIPEYEVNHSIPVEVVRTEKGGTGIMITEYSKITRNILARVMGDNGISFVEPSMVIA
ncbi:MAG: hypothetical protein BMS9Abin26_0300 [Gammaproteobacteria bacterium]|nr:MAG: hypothetical protein BMS9Abin26_0300 [Gammaproteobacteria bacterium]